MEKQDAEETTPHGKDGSASTTGGWPSAKQPLIQPFWDELAEAENVLVAGCGGGYDVFSGLPLMLALHRAGKRVCLASLAFTRGLNVVTGRRVTDICVEVTADSVREGLGYTPEKDPYFPELHLAIWLRKHLNMEVPVYTFPSAGVVPLKKAYEGIVELRNIDTIILADGGTDSLMRGDEEELGTPTEDMASICAVNELKVPTLKRKYLTCIGFGIDAYHGVNHSLFLENVAYHMRHGGFLGSFSLLPQHQEAQEFIKSYESCLPENSIVCSSVASAVEGRFGDYHRESTRTRTFNSKLFINPLMSIYWCFSLPHVAESIYYLSDLLDTRDYGQVRAAIHNWRDRCLDMRKDQGKGKDKKGKDKKPKDKSKSKEKQQKSQSEKEDTVTHKLAMRQALVFPH